MPLLRPLCPTHFLSTRRHFHATAPASILEPTLTATHALFTTLHTTTALPWVTLIPITAILLRTTITTPLTIYSRHRALQTLRLQPLISAWQHPLSRLSKTATATPQAWESSTRKAITRKRAEILKRHGCQRWKVFVAPLLQLPVWVVASVTLRGMTGRGGLWAGEQVVPVEESFAVEGAWWFQNLLVADPVMVLPMVFVFFMFANIEMQTLNHPPSTRTQRIFTNAFRIIPFVAFPMIIDVPAALTLYWSTSAAFSLVQNIVLSKLMPRPEETEPCKSVDPYRIPRKLGV